MKSDTRSFYVQAVQRVIEHAAVHLDEAVALDRLAAEACLSPFHSIVSFAASLARRHSS
jgi:hypothetical protein